MQTCMAPNCTNEVKKLGYCNKHCIQIHKFGRLTPEREHMANSICTHEGCTKRAVAKGYCTAHYRKSRKGHISTGVSTRIHGSEAKYKIDAITAKTLVDEYDITLTELGKLVGTSKETIRLRVESGSSNANWVHKSVTDEEKDAILEMANKSMSMYDKDELYIHITNNGHEPCILIKNGKAIKVIFVIPAEIKDVLLQNKYDIFNRLDRELYNNIEIVYRNGIKCGVFNSKTLKHRLYGRISELGIAKTEYAKLLGVDSILNGMTMTDDEIRTVLDKFSDSEKNVHIPCGADDRVPEYQCIASMAHRAGMGMQEFIKLMGYNQIAHSKPGAKRKSFEACKPLLEECRIADGSNEVYLPVRSDVYKYLQRYAKEHNVTIDSLVGQIGFKRVTKAERRAK